MSALAAIWMFAFVAVLSWSVVGAVEAADVEFDADAALVMEQLQSFRLLFEEDKEEDRQSEKERETVNPLRKT